jgi:hypothetical protein
MEGGAATTFENHVHSQPIFHKRENHGSKYK